MRRQFFVSLPLSSCPLFTLSVFFVKYFPSFFMLVFDDAVFVFLTACKTTYKIYDFSICIWKKMLTRENIKSSAAKPIVYEQVADGQSVKKQQQQTNEKTSIWIEFIVFKWKLNKTIENWLVAVGQNGILCACKIYWKLEHNHIIW